MRVVLIGPTAPRFKGGIVHYTQCLFAEFKRQKYAVTLFSFSRGYPRRFFPGAVPGFKTGKQPKNLSTVLSLDWANPWSWFQTAKLIAAKQPEVVVWQWWTWFWTVPFLITLWLLKRFNAGKIVIIAHNPFDHEQALYKQWGSRLVLRQADVLLVPNRQMQKELKHLFPKKSVKVALHPLYDFFKTLKNANYPKHLAKKSPSPLLLFFGHVRSYKGLKILLLALKQLWQQEKQVKLLVVGEFWENKQPYLQLIDPKHRQFVQIIDRYVSDKAVGKYFQKATAVVIPYLSGSGSGPAKIALAFNKPIIATRVADNPDLFRMAKVGELIKPNSVSELARAIIKVLANPNKYQTEIVKIKPLLSWQNLVNKIAQ